jgi:hypothetical protein
MSAHIPSVDALQSNDDSWLAAELQLAHLRSQVAVILALADRLGQFARLRGTAGLGEQLAEERERLEWRSLHAMGSPGGSRRAEYSGVFARRPSLGSAG